jgi:hypothetical protein
MGRPITDTLRNIQGGALVDEATDALRELLVQVDETGRGGKLVLELTVSKLTRGGAVAIKGRVKTTMPPVAPAEGVFWVSPEGDALTEDPNQQKLDLKVAQQPPRELRTAT